MANEESLQGLPDFDKLEIVKTGYATVGFASDGTTTTETVAHNLGYVPVVIAFLDTTGSTGIIVPLPIIGVESTGVDAGKVYQYISCSADITNLYIYNQSQLQGTGGGPVRYFLLRERANT